jgi:MFS family permease
VSGQPSDDEPTEPSGSLRPTSAAALTAWGVVGVLGGLLLRPLAERMNGSAPIVTLAQPLALLLVAAILGVTAWSTWRTVHVRRDRLEPHQAVNRLVLARACAYAGALVGGGYLGYAIIWIGDKDQLADQRAWRSGLGAVAGLAIVITALLLERACRVPSKPDET